MASLVWTLETVLKKPIFDETGLPNRYDFSSKWGESPDEPNPDAWVKSVRNKLGLELAPEK